MTKKLTLADIRLDGGTQPRTMTDPTTVENYKEALGEGVKFPPVDVFFDGEHHWLADGFHRFIAHHEIGRTEIHVEIHKGSLRDAILFAVGANAHHGKPRSILDRRRCVELLLKDDEWKAHTDAWIAVQAHVSTSLVGSMRKELNARADIRRTRNGKKIDSRKFKDNGVKSRETKVKKREMAAPSEDVQAAVNERLYANAISAVRGLPADYLTRLRDEVDARLQMVGAA